MHEVPFQVRFTHFNFPPTAFKAEARLRVPFADEKTGVESLCGLPKATPPGLNSGHLLLAG